MKKAFFTSLFFLSLISAFNNSHAYKVGILMPTQNEDRWYKDGPVLERMLQGEGFSTELFYAGDLDIELQQRQIKRLVNEGCDALVIGSIDGSALTEALRVAKQSNVKVISYDRLITGSDAVSYYSTFDNAKVGEIQGKFLVNKLKLNETSTPKYIELFYGSIDDNNAKFFYNGAMKYLKPYIDDGRLVIRSKLTNPEDIQTPGWSGQVANKRMSDLIEKYDYRPNGNKLDAILSPADCVSEGIITALRHEGFNESNMPLITGQDATPVALEYVKNGQMGMTIFKDPKTLAKAVVNMIRSIASGKTPEINDQSTYDNGVFVVPSYLCEPVLITKKNLHEVR